LNLPGLTLPESLLQRLFRFGELFLQEIQVTLDTRTRGVIGSLKPIFLGANHLDKLAAAFDQCTHALGLLAWQGANLRANPFAEERQHLRVNRIRLLFAAHLCGPKPRQNLSFAQD
jgi:hypothetical protein